MTEEIIDRKIDEYIARADTAMRSGDYPGAKKAVGTAIVLTRRQARAAVNKIMATSDELRVTERNLKDLRKEGVSFPLVERWCETLSSLLALERKELSITGLELCIALDYWQELGATLADLCNLCNRDPAQVLSEVGADWMSKSFSELVYIYTLDFKSNREWLDYSVDAPLTHAIRAYFLDTMLNTPEGQAAARKALEQTFPGITSNALHFVTDADGNRRIVNKNGKEIEA